MASHREIFGNWKPGTNSADTFVLLVYPIRVLYPNNFEYVYFVLEIRSLSNVSSRLRNSGIWNTNSRIRNSEAGTQLFVHLVS